MSDQPFTVEKIIGEPREYTDSYGPKLSYKLELSGVGVAELSQKPTTAPPRVGDVIIGTLQPARDERFPPKLRKAQQSGGGPRPEDPDKQRRIARMHAQEMALRLAAIQVELGAVQSLTKESLLPLIDWFEKDAA